METKVLVETKRFNGNKSSNGNKSFNGTKFKKSYVIFCGGLEKSKNTLT